MIKNYHIVPSSGEARPCPTKKKCRYKESVHGTTLEETRTRYEESMTAQLAKKTKTISHRNTEFNTIYQSFPDPETIRRFSEIIEKYGKEELYGVKSLVDHPQLFKKPSELFLMYSFMNAQQKASSIEKFIYKKLGGEKVGSSEDKGDAKIKDKYYEIKTSTTNQGNNLNIRQIRLYQDVDYYICSYIMERDLEKSRVYLLTKEEMIEEVSKIGGFTHGTKKANENKINPEHSITIDVYNENNENTKRWNKKYWYNALYEALKDEE